VDPFDPASVQAEGVVCDFRIGILILVHTRSALAGPDPRRLEQIVLGVAEAQIMCCEAVVVLFALRVPDVAQLKERGQKLSRGASRYKLMGRRRELVRCRWMAFQDSF
jgi:hypothetical protein